MERVSRLIAKSMLEDLNFSSHVESEIENVFKKISLARLEVIKKRRRATLLQLVAIFMVIVSIYDLDVDLLSFVFSSSGGKVEGATVDVLALIMVSLGPYVAKLAFVDFVLMECRREIKTRFHHISFLLDEVIYGSSYHPVVGNFLVNKYRPKIFKFLFAPIVIFAIISDVLFELGPYISGMIVLYYYNFSLPYLDSRVTNWACITLLAVSIALAAFARWGKVRLASTERKELSF